MPYDQDGNWTQDYNPYDVNQSGQAEAPNFAANTEKPDGGAWEDSAGSGTQFGQPIPPKKQPTGTADSAWLNWIHSQFGDSASRGGGFADLPSGMSMADVVSKFNADTGFNAKVAGGASGDMVDFGQGARDVKTAGGQLWYNYGPGGPPGQPQTSNMAAWTGQPANSVSSQSGSTSASTSVSGPSPEEIAMKQQREAMRKQLFDQLMVRSQQGLNVDRNDPAVRGQADAYAANEQRSARNYLSDIAEQRGPYATGNIRNEQRMTNERVGQRTGAFESELMGREISAKRQEIAQALSSMQGLLSTEDQLTLQKEMAQMDDAMRKLQLSQQGSQFGQDLGYRYANLAQQGSQFNQSQQAQQDQFLAQLGLTAADRKKYWDSVDSGKL